ncbi:CD44 antigen isoform X10 [Anolis sagrei]|uniref:CD44 antigen isoform X10 n=1 Tax=Anolis sagrei TaxID=38937 RepID=UPI0035200C34
MAKFWLCAAVGLYLLQLCSAQIGLNISCRYAGVFHVEKNHRYSLTREDAIALCKALNSTIPTFEQMKKAYDLGFETCRYGYIEDKVVVPRHTPYHLCAANNTGIYILSSNVSDRYDTYCFNSSETRDKVCDPVIKLYSAWPNNGSTIEIFNADGSRYIEGQKFTERPPITDDEITAGSGSANDRPTTDPNFIRHGISHYADRVTPPYHVGASDEVEDHSKDQHTQHPTDEVSNNRKHHENSTEGQHIPQEFPLWWPPEENERRQSTIFGKDESSEENDDDGGGDDDDDSEEGSGHINPETVIEWDNSGDQELQPSNNTVISSKDVKYEDTTHEPLLHGVYSGKRNDVKYSTNGPQTAVPHGHPHLAEHEHYSTTTAVSPSNDFFKQEESNGLSQDGNHSGLETKDTVLTTTNSSHQLHPGLVPSKERESTLENESFHHTAVASNDNGKHEDSTEDPLLHGMHPEWESKSDLPMNTTRDHVPPEIIPSNEMMHGNENEISHTGGEEYEDSMQDSPTDKTLTGWTSEPRHPANQSKDYWVPGIILPTENVHGKETPHKDSAQPPIHQPGPETEEVYSTSISSTGVLVGIYSESENHPLSTDVVYDGTKEDTTLEPVRQWVSEDKYTTKSPADVIIPGIVPRRGINQKNKTEHTAVAATDGSKKEEPTQMPSLHEMNPGQSNGDEHLLNNTQDYMIPGVFSAVDNGSDRQPSNSDSSSPGGHGRGVSHSGDVTPQPGGSPNSQKRRAVIPDWLIVVASLLALALILGVCIAVNSRRRCGQKKKLMINNGKGGISEKNTGGLNGEASKSQEMVNLVQKEKLDDQTGPRDEFLAIDETQNQQEVALKSGV